ncbi:uncharacterized protein G2W53_007350 [Senna tora]|uniref:Uncharacterized protein n=1 Tax=Senna tora TaxID=362788 RepID=A0A834X576_9FABA|nr:uncharacterized protein G2W53_007350 [Senna tora]
MDPSFSVWQDTLMANVDKGWNMVVDRVDPCGSQGAHSSEKGQATLTKNPKKNHDPSMEGEDPRRALDIMFLDAPTCCRQRIPPPQMENFIANIKREIAKGRHSSTNEARRLHAKRSAYKAKTRSFVYGSSQSPSSWLTLMILASEAKTKSCVYGKRVRRPWQRQGASRVL